MKSVVVVDHKPVTDKTIAEFNAAAESKDVYYRLTGTETGIADAGQFGNFTLKNGEDEVYVYGLLSGWGGPKKQFESLGIKEGDTVTLVGVRSSYNNKIQVGNAFYVSHETPATE